MTDSASAYPAILCRDVTRIYRLPGKRQRVAVEHLSLEVPAGVVFGFLGANGAGKTTTIKMLLGFLPPSSGRLEIFGRSCADHRARDGVGYLPEQPYFPSFLSPAEVLKVHAELIGLPRKRLADEIDRALEVTKLDQNRNLPLARLSKGNQQRVGIAQALLGSPRLLVLDEPTSGLDPVGRHEMRQIITRLRSEGCTVFLSSHILSEVDTLCDRIGVISSGHLVASGRPEQIKQGDSSVRIETSGMTVDAERELDALGAEILAADPVVIRVAPEGVYPVFHALERFGLPVLSVRSERESLEAAFLRLAA